MSCLTYRGSQTAYADTVAAHHRIFHRAVGVCIGHVHGLGIFGAKLEDISYLDTAFYLNSLFAAAGADAACFDLGHVCIFYFSQISWDI